MSIKIKQINEDLYSIDGLLASRNSDGKWIGSPQMTSEQIAAFQQHINSVERPVIDQDELHGH